MYDLYHNIYRHDRIRQKVTFSTELMTLLQKHKLSGQGLLIAAPHLSSIDLAGISLALGGVEFSIISYPQPPSGYRLHNKIRQDVGIEVLPASFNNLRIAGERLQEGKIVITGIDRPMQESNYIPDFFGHPAKVPVTPVRLALKHNAMVAVCACISSLKGRYEIAATEQIPLVRHPNLSSELTINTERILQEVEQLIRAHPEQWAMFYPVWPKLSGTMPI
jgi:KDO2-lipid IV(A) lauroyltransferase